MLHQIALLATVTILGVLEQAYFAMQVIYARRKCKISPPLTAGPPEFERIFRAQERRLKYSAQYSKESWSDNREWVTEKAEEKFGANCSEYFPIFLSLLWVAGVFSNQVLAASCGLIYLYARYQYFAGYTHSAQERLSPLYFSAAVLCVLIALSVVGLTAHFMTFPYF